MRYLDCFGYCIDGDTDAAAGKQFLLILNKDTGFPQNLQ